MYKCPKCGKKMEEGRIGCEPPRWWIGCDPCGVYISARTEEELKQRFEQLPVNLVGFVDEH